MAFTYITITRDYNLADGLEPNGGVYFTPSTALTNSGTVVVAAAVFAPLDVNGQISISLVANTDPTTTPAGSTYTVREEIAGQSRSYTVTIPHNAGSPIDLTTLE